MRTVDTKTHIVETSRHLFNSKGFGSVTNAAIAEATGRTEGNVWYHFKNKRDILEAISAQLVERFDVRRSLRPNPDGDIINEYANMLRVFADEIRDFRFLYRDQADFGEFSTQIRSIMPKLYSDTFDQFKLYFEVMIQQQLLENNPKQLDTILEASIIAIRYSLEIRREMGKANAPDSGGVRHSFELHIKLLESLLTPEASKRLRAELIDCNQPLT